MGTFVARTLAWVALAGGWGYASNQHHEAHAPNTRVAWTWPFASTSIWNMPIGGDARYLAADLPASRVIGCDVEWHLRTTMDDPIVPVHAPSSWEQRWPGGKKLGELRIPRDLIIPDASPPHTPNACAVFLMPDGRTLRQIEPACRPDLQERIVGWLHPEDQDLYGDGIKGTHYGSGLSALGGSIRQGELVSPQPLRHALKLNVWGKHLYYGHDVPGYRWPADRADSYAAERYLGNNRRLVMGTLLALPTGVAPDDLRVQSEVGLKIFHALQDYGAYISDDTAWDAYDLCVERGVPEEVEVAYGYSLIGETGKFVDEMKRMISALMIVDNNSPETIGGGGVPRRPMAPALVEPTKGPNRPAQAGDASIQPAPDTDLKSEASSGLRQE